MEDGAIRADRHRVCGIADRAVLDLDELAIQPQASLLREVPALTDAELGSEICEAWADRVRWAKVCWDEGRLEECQRAIEDANRYAV